MKALKYDRKKNHRMKHSGQWKHWVLIWFCKQQQQQHGGGGWSDVLQSSWFLGNIYLNYVFYGDTILAEQWLIKTMLKLLTGQDPPSSYRNAAFNMRTYGFVNRTQASTVLCFLVLRLFAFQRPNRRTKCHKIRFVFFYLHSKTFLQPIKKSLLIKFVSWKEIWIILFSFVSITPRVRSQ